MQYKCLSIQWVASENIHEVDKDIQLVQYHCYSVAIIVHFSLKIYIGLSFGLVTSGLGFGLVASGLDLA